jgi:pimeloyl-ACP methyl ester carboxylesterase
VLRRRQRAGQFLAGPAGAHDQGGGSAATWPRRSTCPRRCGERNGALLAHISTADTARDLDHLRRLVGDRQLTYLGESFGTLIGQTYANLFPRGCWGDGPGRRRRPRSLPPPGLEAILASGCG